MVITIVNLHNFPPLILDINLLHLYIIHSGSAVETRDAHSPGSSCVDSLFSSYGGLMSKVFFTYEQQLDKLEKENSSKEWDV